MNHERNNRVRKENVRKCREKINKVHKATAGKKIDAPEMITVASFVRLLCTSYLSCLLVSGMFYRVFLPPSYYHCLDLVRWRYRSKHEKVLGLNY
ncbi:MAG: hypothetical protein ACTSRA_09565 [Promethearchaeota archaeon]